MKLTRLLIFLLLYISRIFEWNEDIVAIGSLGNEKPP